jgi:predicted metal-dependent HD superfamily phosphohydrolase
METNDFTKLRKVYELVKDFMPTHPYHGHEHAKDVFYAANRLSKIEGVSREERLILQTAALLHDIVFFKGANDNEEKSAEFATPYLRQYSYSQCQINRVNELILATKLPTNPKNLLENIICDADLDILGRKDFFEKNNEYRKELGAENDLTWCSTQLRFLRNHKYYTCSAQELRGEGLKNNTRRIEKMLRGA